ncbi:radical SAM protein, partial [Patescibacteria group bacterium]|nr:radical SAM protein [Patescibacteria group bacterium]
MRIKKALNNFPLRVSITDHCNLNCFFCSNEGMDFKNRNNHEIDLESFKYLVKTTKVAGLQTLSLTGGEPTIYSKIEELLDFVVSQKIPRTFFHTNGIALTKKLIDKYLVHFSKLAVSIHTTNYKIWKQLTRGKEEQFEILLENLNYLGELSKKKKIKVEVKVVPIKGINDSSETIKDFLDLCS